ncbi:MAG TPA: alpha/beta fold hydrolase [Polyangiaceae bacterium]|nr:alpha/beta fold hydrolase [Polyangiaceae bacterium]
MSCGTIDSVEAPRIQFASTARGKVAFQALGDAKTSFVLVPPLAQHIEMMWEQPVFWRPIQRLASAFRFVQYDKLGTGLSDPSSGTETLDQRLEELSAVLDAAAVERTWLGGFSEGSVIALAAAARMPERVAGLILISAYSGNTALSEAAHYGPIPDRREFRAFFEQVVSRWGTEATLTLSDFAPSLRSIPAMSRWVPRYERAAASPAMIGALMTSGLRLDATPVLSEIEQPALVLHLAGDRVIPAAFGRMLAQRLKNARHVELPGDDHFSWISPSIDEQLDLIFEFTGVSGNGPRVSAVWEPWSLLTPSERRSVSLAQRGLTNTEIARQLKLSTRTVENHLARSYAKLGVRSRTELALLKRA